MLSKLLEYGPLFYKALPLLKHVMKTLCGHELINAKKRPSRSAPDSVSLMMFLSG